MESFLAQLRANRVTLRHLMAAARAGGDLEVFESREATTEALRQLCGHIDRLMAEKHGDSDLRAAYDDLERRFQTWRDGEAQRMKEYLKFASELTGLRDNIWGAWQKATYAEYRVNQMDRALREAGIEIEEDNW